jgi:hypothetical protein
MRVHPWHANAPEQLPTRHGPIASRLYVPEGTIRRATVLTPGIHAMGIDEPRLKGLAGDLAASGVAVLTIALPDLTRYRFSSMRWTRSRTRGCGCRGNQRWRPMARLA